MKYEKYEQRYKKFKDTIKEEEEIISRINENLKINESSKILDIGGNNGKISQSVQRNSNNITIIDIKEINLESEAKYIQNEWERVNLKDKFDIILASHVWGCLGHKKSQKYSFDKMINYLEQDGKLVICYNTNNDFMKKVVKFSNETFENPMYDYFDEDLIKGYWNKEIKFSTPLKANSFKDLTELTHILSLCPDEEFEKEKSKIYFFLKDNLKKPKFDLEQKLVMVNKS